MSLSVIYWNVDPNVIPGWGMPRWYGVMWIFGIYTAYKVMEMIYKKEGKDLVELYNLVFYIMVSAVIGARLGHVFFYDWAYYSQHPIEILPIKLEPSFHFTGLNGLASHGGIFAGFFGLYLYNRKRKINYLWLLDRITICAGMLGGAIRLGNLFNSEIFGKATDLPWAFVFQRVDNVPRHPTQLYEALFYFGTTLVFYQLYKRKPRRPGYFIGLGAAVIFGQRFLVEFIKENQVDFEAGMALNMGQLLSIPIILFGLIVWFWSLKGGQRPLALDSQDTDENDEEHSA